MYYYINICNGGIRFNLFNMGVSCTQQLFCSHGNMYFRVKSSNSKLLIIKIIMAPTQNLLVLLYYKIVMFTKYY